MAADGTLVRSVTTLEGPGVGERVVVKYAG
jgi:hypothetical protein